MFGFSELAGIEFDWRITLQTRQFQKTEHPTPVDFTSGNSSREARGLR